MWILGAHGVRTVTFAHKAITSGAVVLLVVITRGLTHRVMRLRLRTLLEMSRAAPSTRMVIVMGIARVMVLTVVAMMVIVIVGVLAHLTTMVSLLVLLVHHVGRHSPLAHVAIEMLLVSVMVVVLTTSSRMLLSSTWRHWLQEYCSDVFS